MSKAVLVIDGEDNIKGKEGVWLIDYKQDEYDKILDEYYVYCSNCHTAVYTDIDPDTWSGGANYCPSCGVRMKNIDRTFKRMCGN